ncbi:MAG: DinB family protein [Stellaceae bacterium]
MTVVSDAKKLARYNAWANRVLFDAVAALPPGEAEKERPSLFKTMIGTLNHLYVIDLMWQAHLEGRPHGFTRRDDVLHPELADLRRAQQAIDQWYFDWAARQTEASLEEPVAFTLTTGNKGAMTRGEILLHVVNHSTYHRGWVCDLFFQVPARPPETDLPVFTREMATEAAA